MCLSRARLVAVSLRETAMKLAREGQTNIQREEKQKIMEQKVKTRRLLVPRVRFRDDA